MTTGMVVAMEQIVLRNCYGSIDYNILIQCMYNNITDPYTCAYIHMYMYTYNTVVYTCAYILLYTYIV